MPAAGDLLPCQRDSYLRQIATTVTSCERRGAGKEHGQETWHVTLAETCLYPEGGGQPCDTGVVQLTAEGVPGEPVRVLDVTRDAEGLVRHTVTRQLHVGDEVLVTVDWHRRYDHMQQHTGQHLLSAVVERVCGADTCSWELHPRSHDPASLDAVNIEITCPTLSPAQLQEIEECCNTAVRDAHAVTFVMSDEFDWPENAPRGLPSRPPAGAPALRLVKIGDLDINPCGGTHLRSTAEIQVVKLLGVEKTRGQARLRFMCGDRVLALLGRCLANEARLTSRLSCGPADHDKAVAKALSECADAVKARKLLSEEVATALAKCLADEPGRVHVHHREGADLTFLGVLASKATEARPDHVFLLTGGTAGKGDRPGDGVFLLAGSSGIVGAFAPQVAQLLDGKGGGRAGRFQGRATHVEKAVAATRILEDGLRT